MEVRLKPYRLGCILSFAAAAGILPVPFSGPRLARAQSGGSAGSSSAQQDSVRRGSRAGIIPAGFGTLRQDDIAVLVQNLGLQVRAIPLEESVIRTLSPDSYKALATLRQSKARQIDSVVTRTGLPSLQAWYLTFFNAEQGEARYDALDVLLRGGGRDFRPLEVLPLKSGFGDGRLAQRTSQSAVYLFDPAIDLTQPVTLTIGTQTSTAWTDILQRVDRERSLVWSRAGSGKP